MKYILIALCLALSVPCYADSGCVDCKEAGERSELLLAPALNNAWTIPVGEAEFFDSKITRNEYDLNLYNKVNLTANMLDKASSGAALKLQYTKNGFIWYDLTPGFLNIDRNGVVEMGWIDINAEARKPNMLIRLVGYNGNGTTEAVFGSVTLSLK